MVPGTIILNGDRYACDIFDEDLQTSENIVGKIADQCARTFFRGWMGMYFMIGEALPYAIAVGTVTDYSKDDDINKALTLDAVALVGRIAMYGVTRMFKCLEDRKDSNLEGLATA